MLKLLKLVENWYGLYIFYLVEGWLFKIKENNLPPINKWCPNIYDNNIYNINIYVCNAHNVYF